jgi:hypothetical protein
MIVAITICTPCTLAPAAHLDRRWGVSEPARLAGERSLVRQRTGIFIEK